MGAYININLFFPLVGGVAMPGETSTKGFLFL